MVEIMPHPVAERAAVNERSLQSKMQAHLSCEVDNALADLRLLRFLGAGEGLTRHHAELADTCHESFVGIAPLFRAILGKRGDDKRYR